MQNALCNCPQARLRESLRQIMAHTLKLSRKAGPILYIQIVLIVRLATVIDKTVILLSICLRAVYCQI